MLKEHTSRANEKFRGVFPKKFQWKCPLKGHFHWNFLGNITFLCNFFHVWSSIEKSQNKTFSRNFLVKFHDFQRYSGNRINIPVKSYLWKKSYSCEKVFVLPRDKTKTFAKKGQKKLQNNVLFAKKYSKHHVWSQWKSSLREHFL